MKEVCREAGIDQQVKGYKLNVETRRKELGTHPKYELLSSHDLRRSFCHQFLWKNRDPCPHANDGSLQGKYLFKLYRGRRKQGYLRQ